MKNILFLAAGGVAGTFARYGLSVVCARFPGRAFPVGTFLVNASGCLLMGFCAAKLGTREGARLLLMTGFCGAYTTFSAFSLEIVELARAGRPLQAAFYAAASVAAGTILVSVGYLYGDRG